MVAPAHRCAVQYNYHILPIHIAGHYSYRTDQVGLAEPRSCYQIPVGTHRGLKRGRAWIKQVNPGMSRKHSTLKAPSINPVASFCINSISTLSPMWAIRLAQTGRLQSSLYEHLNGPKFWIFSLFFSQR